MRVIFGVIAPRRAAPYLRNATANAATPTRSRYILLPPKKYSTRTWLTRKKSIPHNVAGLYDRVVTRSSQLLKCCIYWSRTVRRRALYQSDGRNKTGLTGLRSTRGHLRLDAGRLESTISSYKLTINSNLINNVLNC